MNAEVRSLKSNAELALADIFAAARRELPGNDALADQRADDVQCGHGSTMGKLDDELKFYLMTRGIPAQEAEALLIQAFVGEVVDAIEVEAVKDALMGATMAWLRE